MDDNEKVLMAIGENQYQFDSIKRVSDGYHTFEELYRFRMLYNAMAMSFVSFANDAGLTSWDANRVQKSKLHSDGKFPFDDDNWFIVMMYIPGQGQISNHYEMKYWDLFDVPELDRADEWDGHTAQDAADRIQNWLQAIADHKKGKK